MKIESIPLRHTFLLVPARFIAQPILALLHTYLVALWLGKYPPVTSHLHLGEELLIIWWK